MEGVCKGKLFLAYQRIDTILELYQLCVIRIYVHCSTNGCLVIEDNGSHDYFLLDIVSMEIIQLPSVEFEYELCDLWQSPSNSNCRIWFMNNDFLMSCQLGDHEYVKKEILY